MPIVIKDFQWEESDKHIFITVPLKGVKPNKVDIFSTEDYIKVSYPPYIFECFLFAPVHDQKGAAEIGNGVVLFKLEKQEINLWSQLHHTNKDDKLWQREKRDEAVKKAHDRAEQEAKEKAELKNQLDKYGVKQQMRMEEQERNKIDQIKSDAIAQATDELEEWKEQQKVFAEKQKENERIEAIEKQKKSASDMVEEAKNKKHQKMNMFHQEAGMTPVRDPGKISVNFTQREFPTPTRESIQPEEDAWLQKQAEARRIAQISDKDLTEEEKNPVWLKDKGDSFFKAGNMLAAINAYSHAIRLDSKLPSLYSNRGACHLKLGNMFKCAEDCSKALELLTPAVPANAASRVKAHVRRGTAYCNLKAYVEGLMDYDAALKIDPNNEQLQSDADQIRIIIQSSDGS